MNHKEAMTFAREISPVLRRMVDDAVRPFAERLAAIEARPVPAGKDGVGIKGAIRDRSNCIILTLSDGNTLNVGEIKDGLDGRDGKDGVDGRDGKDADLSGLEQAIFEQVGVAVAALPVAKDGRDGRDGIDGKDVDQSAIVEMVVAAVAEIPAPKDGKDADPKAVAEIVKAEILPIISREILDAVAASPGPQNGKGANPDTVAVRAMIVAEVAQLPKPKDGADGKDADPQVVAEIVKAEIEPALRERISDLAAALPIPKNGRDADPEEIGRLVDEKVSKAVAAIPVPKDGAPGRDGKDGANGAGIAGAVINRDGHLIITLADGTTVDLGPIVGKDGEPGAPGKDGRDGFGFDDLEVVSLGEKGFVFRFTRGDQVKEFILPVMGFVYRGVWKEGEFAAGDAVTWGGSLFMADRATKAKPETPEGVKDWRLAVKRGRDGKDGKPGEKGDPGPKGKDGRDLTQMGPDGSKW